MDASLENIIRSNQAGVGGRMPRSSATFQILCAPAAAVRITSCSPRCCSLRTHSCGRWTKNSARWPGYRACPSSLHERSHSLVHSLAFGDSPALICEMVDLARSAGFEGVAAGKGTKYLPAYHASTPDTAWRHSGLSAEDAEMKSEFQRQWAAA